MRYKRNAGLRRLIGLFAGAALITLSLTPVVEADRNELGANSASATAAGGGVTEESRISEAIDRYIQGSSYNDPDLIRSAFYDDDAEMYLSHPEKEIFLMSAGEYADRFGRRERGVHNGRVGAILKIERTNDIALASAAIGFEGEETRYVDLFLLKRIEGEWKILSKAATRTD